MNSRLTGFGILLVFALFSFSVSARPVRLLLKNGVFLDPRNQTATHGQLLIEGDKIIRLSTDEPSDSYDRVLDLENKWVLPGLIDSHVHAAGNLSPNGSFHHLALLSSARSFLFSGVTSILDLFNEENSIFQLRNKQRRGELPGTEQVADVFAAGPIFTVTGGHGTEYGMFTRTIDTPEQAELEMNALIYKKPDVIKFVYGALGGRMPVMDRATLERGIQIAHRHGLRTVIHIEDWQRAEEALDLGADALTHIPDGEIPESLMQKLKSKNVALIPTLSVQMELNNIAHDLTVLKRPLLQALVPTAFLNSFGRVEAYSPTAKTWLKWQSASRQKFQNNFRRFVQEGITVLAGTDSGNMGVFQGYSLHREMELMVEAGASSWQALKAATAANADFLRLNAGYSPGDRANFLVLNNSPLMDIKHTQDIHMVIYHGQVVDRENLKSEISKAPCLGCQ